MTSSLPSGLTEYTSGCAAPGAKAVKRILPLAPGKAADAVAGATSARPASATVRPLHLCILDRRTMAKKVLTMIKLQIPAGAANPAPPVGPALGQHGVNIMEFCKAFNARTQADAGTIIPVEITVYRGPQLRLHHQDAAGRRADPRGARDRQGLGRARTARRSAA